jgi:hypothetical protein
VTDELLAADALLQRTEFLCLVRGDWEGYNSSRDAITKRKSLSLLEAEPWFSDCANVVITPWLYLGGTWFYIRLLNIVT